MKQNNSSRTRIALIGHKHMFTELLAHTISEQNDMDVVAELRSPQAARESLGGTDMDLAVVSVESHDGSAIQLIKHLKDSRPHVKVVALSADSSRDLFLSAVEAGADCFMVKDRPLNELMQSLRVVRDGYCMYDCTTFRVAITELLKDRVVGRTTAGLDLARLSPRERQVARLLSTGLSNKEIAHSLGISLSTTKTHVSRVYEQLGVSSRRELLARFYGVK